MNTISDKNIIKKFNITTNDDFIDIKKIPDMIDSQTSRCIKIKTSELPAAIVINSDGSSMSDVSGTTNSSILTRRFGLIVGCCMGFIVFILLISVLGYLKVKKQRETVKRDQQPIPPEYISYRHFSIQSGDGGGNATRANNNQDTQHQQGFVNNIGNTPLNV